MEIGCFFWAGYMNTQNCEHKDTKVHSYMHKTKKCDPTPHTQETEQMSADGQGAGVTIISRYARVANVCFLNSSPTTSYQGMD